MASASSAEVATTAESTGLRMTRVTIALQNRDSPVGRPYFLLEGEPALLDAVAEPSQNRRQDNQRDEHLDRNDD